MSLHILYETSARAIGNGRDGHSATLDDSLSITMKPPKELGGSGEGNNPEQLFAVGYAACFLGALRVVALQQKLKLSDETTITSTVGLGKKEDGGFGLAVGLAVTIPGVEHSVAQELVAKAHTVCPYSNAVKGNIDVQLSVVPA